MFDLQDKHILITGATGHLGKKISVDLAKMGAIIYVNSRTRAACMELVDEIKSNGDNAICAAFDVTHEQSIKEFSNSTNQLDVLINNAYTGNGGTLLTAKVEDYVNSFEATVIASANLIKAFEPHLAKSAKENGHSSIINIASIYGMISPDARLYDNDENCNPPFYGSAKAALIQLTKYAACELAMKNIRVNCIAPGPFPTNEVQCKSPELIKLIENKVPMGRIGSPEELVGPVAFLASKASSFVTGINLPVDGGWTSW